MLDTIRESCRAPYGAVSFARARDLKPLITYGIFPPEIMMLWAAPAAIKGTTSPSRQRRAA